MRKRIVVVLVSLAALLAVSFTARTQSTDPWMGTWKVDLAKSTYKPGPKPTVAGTVKIEPMAGGFKTTIDATIPQGQPTHTETVGKFDGKDNPVTGAPVPNTTAAYKRINGRTFEVLGKVDGKGLAAWELIGLVTSSGPACIGRVPSRRWTFEQKP